MEEIHIMRNVMVCIFHQVYKEINILCTSSHIMEQDWVRWEKHTKLWLGKSK